MIVEEKRGRSSSSRSEAARSDPRGPPLPAGTSGSAAQSDPGDPALPAGTSGSEARSGQGPLSATWSDHLFCIAVPLFLSCHKMNTQYS